MCHVDEIEAVAGGYCSIHNHSAKANVFHVVSGLLYVRQFTGQGDRLKCGTLAAGQSLVVPAGVWHQFWSRLHTTAVEVYLPSAGICEHEDIERHPGLAIGGVALTYAEMEDLWSRAFGGCAHACNCE